MAVTADEPSAAPIAKDKDDEQKPEADENEPPEAADEPSATPIAKDEDDEQKPEADENEPPEVGHLPFKKHYSAI
eukprot:5171188-Amphidinium_carterae.1